MSRYALRLCALLNYLYALASESVKELYILHTKVKPSLGVYTSLDECLDFVCFSAKVVCCPRFGGTANLVSPITARNDVFLVRLPFDVLLLIERGKTVKDPPLHFSKCGCIK